MKIFNNVQIPRVVQSFMIAAPLLMSNNIIRAQQVSDGKDVFIKSQEICAAIEGKDPMEFSPEVEVANDIIFPAVVVDLSEKRLYHYDYDGYLKDVYPVAIGKSSTPTKTGLRMINNIEKYPYSAAPKTTKRAKNPRDYGTHLLNLSIVDTETGRLTGNNGQYIHGTNNPNSIGKSASKGCIRVYNHVIDTLAKNLSKKQYVLIRE